MVIFVLEPAHGAVDARRLADLGLVLANGTGFASVRLIYIAVSADGTVLASSIPVPALAAALASVHAFVAL